MADYNSLVNLYRTATKADEEEEKRKQNQIYDNQAQVIKDTYDSDIKTSEADYNELEREAEIQRLINKNEVAEDMANIGHRDSGLSRDQTAAVNIAASNQRAKISLARQQAKEAKMLEMKAKLAEIENNRLASDNAISSAYTKLATDNAAAYIKQEQENAQKSVQENSSSVILSYDKNSKKVYDKSGNLCNVYYGTDGNEYLAKIGTNPYTNTNNLKSDSVKVYGTFSNGYQPKGISGIGKLKETGDELWLTGKRQKVWYTEDKKGTKRYWLWIGVDNAYQEYTLDKKTGEYVATTNEVYIKEA